MGRPTRRRATASSGIRSTSRACCGASRGTIFNIATLPSVARPAGRVIFAAAHSHPAGETARVDVGTDGTVIMRGGNTSTPWVSLDGIVFERSAGTAIPLRTGVTAYGRTYAPPTGTVMNGVVQLQGLVQTAHTRGAVLMTLPSSMRPAGRIVVEVRSSRGVERMDILPNGEVHAPDADAIAWISLSGVAFSRQAGTTPTYDSGHSPYASPYQAAGGERAERRGHAPWPGAAAVLELRSDALGPGGDAPRAAAHLPRAARRRPIGARGRPPQRAHRVRGRERWRVVGHLDGDSIRGGGLKPSARQSMRSAVAAMASAT